MSKAGVRHARPELLPWPLGGARDSQIGKVRFVGAISEGCAR